MTSLPVPSLPRGSSSMMSLAEDTADKKCHEHHEKTGKLELEGRQQEQQGQQGQQGHDKNQAMRKASNDFSVKSSSGNNEQYSSVQSSSFLRSDETVESLFCLDENSNWHHRKLCHEICFGDKLNDARAWSQVLEYSLHVQHCFDNQLIQLHQRATSRFELNNQANQKRDILKLWLSLALTQLGCNQLEDAAQTYQFIQQRTFPDQHRQFYMAINNSDNSQQQQHDSSSLKLLKTMLDKERSPVRILRCQMDQLQMNCSWIRPRLLVLPSLASKRRPIQPLHPSMPLQPLQELQSSQPASNQPNHDNSLAPELNSSDSHCKIKNSIIAPSTDNSSNDDQLKPWRTRTLYKKRNLSSTPSTRDTDKTKKRSMYLSSKRTRTGGALRAILSNDAVDEDDIHPQSSSSSSSSSTLSHKHDDSNADLLKTSPNDTSTSKINMDLEYLKNWDPNQRQHYSNPSQPSSSSGSNTSNTPKQSLNSSNATKSSSNTSNATKPSFNTSNATKQSKSSPSKQSLRKITKSDLGYMLNWDPMAARKQKEHNSTPKTNEESDFSSDHDKETNSGSIHPHTPQTSSSSTAQSVTHETTTASSSSSSSQTNSKLESTFLPLIDETNIIRVNHDPYAKLGVIGKGGSCKVHRVLSKDCSVVALKHVNIDGLTSLAIDGYANEIALLKRLKGNPAIIQLFSSEVDLERKSIYLVMELGEVDLNYVLRQQELMSSKQGCSKGRSSLNMNFIRLTWQQMLTAVHSIHEERIIHSDLKPANFLFVRGALKLIDFGIAKAIEREDTTNIYRESLSGTLSYMSPEAILGSSTNEKGDRVNKCGRASDIWSLGCILYQMVYGKTPFADCHGIPQKVLAITNPNHRIEFPKLVDEAAIDAMNLCLRRNPKERATIVGDNGLLNEHRFLHSNARSVR